MKKNCKKFKEEDEHATSLINCAMEEIEKHENKIEKKFNKVQEKIEESQKNDNKVN